VQKEYLAGQTNSTLAALVRVCPAKLLPLWDVGERASHQECLLHHLQHHGKSPLPTLLPHSSLIPSMMVIDTVAIESEWEKV